MCGLTGPLFLNRWSRRSARQLNDTVLATLIGLISEIQYRLRPDLDIHYLHILALRKSPSSSLAAPLLLVLVFLKNRSETPGQALDEEIAVAGEPAWDSSTSLVG